MDGSTEVKPREVGTWHMNPGLCVLFRCSEGVLAFGLLFGLALQQRFAIVWAAGDQGELGSVRLVSGVL